MSPPGLLAAPGIGGTATPTKNELIEVGRVWLDHFHINFGNSKLFRLAINFKAKCPHAGRYMFVQYLCSALEISVEHQQRALRDPDVARVISYTDRVGELAVDHAMGRRLNTLS